ncbi:hypothetical protein BGZ58_009182, partial [Dissophora ornata]
MTPPNNDDNKAVQALALPELVDAIALHLKSQRVIATACLVCKVWREAWTPLLWRSLGFDRSDGAVPDSIVLQGHHTKNLTYDYPKDEHLDLVLPHCPNLQSLNLSCTKATIEVLAPFLMDLGGRRLRQFELDTYMIRASDLLPVLVGHCHRLEQVILSFPYFKERSELSSRTLMRLLEMCPRLRELELTWVEILDDVTEVVGESEGEEHVVQSRLEILSLDAVTQSDTSFLGLLERCPQLWMLHVGGNPTLTNASIYRIPELCPNLDSLTIILQTRDRHASSTHTFEQLFQKTDWPLKLRYLCLSGDSVDDRVVAQIASSQAPSLRTLDLRHCREVTDLGVELVLRRCALLETLLLFGTAVTNAIMEGPQERWKCFETLKELDIRKIGVTDLGHRYPQDDPRIKQNREAFTKIRRRVQMLPRLQKLAMSFYGIHEELLQGFYYESTQGEDGGGRMLDCEVMNGADAACSSTVATSRESGGNVAVQGSPRLRTLNALGASALLGEDMDRFLDNYPYLTRLVMNRPSSSHEMRERLFGAG